MIAGTTLGAETSDVTSACWMVAGSCALVGSKMAPCNLQRYSANFFSAILRFLTIPGSP